MSSASAAPVVNSTLEDTLRAIVPVCESREDLWVDFINTFRLRQVAEIGVYRGDFSPGTSAKM